MPGPKGVPGEKGGQFYSQEEVRTLVLSTLKVYVDTNPTERTNLENREYRREGGKKSGCEGKGMLKEGRERGRKETRMNRGWGGRLTEENRSK